MPPSLQLELLLPVQGSPLELLPLVSLARPRRPFQVRTRVFSSELALRPRCWWKLENELFYRPNTLMLFADAKKMCEDIVKALDA